VLPSSKETGSAERHRVLCLIAKNMQHPSPPIQALSQGSWTDCIPKTEHNALFLNYDFSTTTLGSTSGWSPVLRAYVTMIFADSRGACLYWGPDKIAIYNEGFAVTCEGAHPFLMGHSFAEAFPELAPAIEPVFQQVSTTGQATNVENIQLFVNRNKYLEETYFIGQFIPLRGDNGEVAGVYNTTLESTSQVIFERRRRVTDQISRILPHSIEQTLSAFTQALQTNDCDITAMLLYTYDDQMPGTTDNLFLESSIAVPESCGCYVEKAHLETSQDGLVPLFRQVSKTGRRMVLDLADDSSSQYNKLFDGVIWRGFGDRPRTIVICPLTISGELLGFYVQGTNPRREYDDATERSIAEITTQLELKWAESSSREQAHLREQMAERRAIESENTLRSLAQNAPLGMYQIGLDRKIKWANDQFYDITGHDRALADMVHFREALAADERENDRNMMEDLLAGASRTVRDVRLCRTWKPPLPADEGSEEDYAWILAVTFPLMEGGEVMSLLGYVTDISRQKWAENTQTRNAAIATDAIRRQEEFLDITSHELRNPLSAITLLADSIIKTAGIGGGGDPDFLRNIISDHTEAASTILACATHQKRIIDDVLVLSRLDSQMLSISRTAACPQDIITSTLKMFEGLAVKHDIEICTARGDGVDELHEVDQVFIDASRLMQVLINLLGNAIKFTADQPVRQISVNHGVRACMPSHFETSFGDLAWVPSTVSKKSRPASLKLKPGEEKIYAYFKVEDTGLGLTAKEMTRLFRRFSQANSKTHITYGGSGLGLHICKELAEKQGGGIGVSSIPAVGTAFVVYLETKAAAATEPLAEDQHPVPMVLGTESSGTDPHSSSVASAPDPEKPIANSTDRGSEAAPIDDESLNVLLVEDNLINQKVLAKQLRKAKCTVAIANHGEEALVILEQSNFWKNNAIGDAYTKNASDPLPLDVVLMDIEMPVMDGLQCTKQIRTLQSKGVTAKHVPIIATTANARQEQKDRIFAAGVDRILVKPFTIEQVMLLIRELIA
jgi:PAS domain S-box-containing protein